MDIKEHLTHLVRTIFPADFEIRYIDRKTSEMIFRAFRKYARKIEIRFDQAVVEDYLDDEAYRSTMDRFIVAYLQAKLAGYKDDGILDPPLDWQVSPEVYLPKPVLPMR